MPALLSAVRNVQRSVPFLNNEAQWIGESCCLGADRRLGQRQWSLESRRRCPRGA